MTDFKMIPLSEIHPDKNQPRKFFDDDSLKELTESVREKGVLQPIMVRPNGNGYILVCGERRFRASVSVQAAFKTRNEIPAVVRNLTDEEALEIQFIENIQRSDVHPMDEATTFKQMMESKVHPYSIADIAAKINKPESYVAHRLVLNNLLPSLQKEFWAGKFLIGQAVLIARLSQEDQKTIDKNARSWQTKEIKSIRELREYIDSNITRKLSSAPFDTKDETLNPKMGACSNCVFRSGNNPSLFSDIKETDRCFNKECFEKKCLTSLIRKVKDTIENKPDVHLVQYYNGRGIDKEILDAIKESGAKILVDGRDCSMYNDSRSIKAKGLLLDSNDRGKIKDIYILNKNKSVVSEDGKPVTSIDMDIAGIKQRTSRAAELDDEKVWTQIHNEIIYAKSSNESGMNPDLITNKKLSAIDTAALIYAMFEKSSASGKILNVFGFKENSAYGGYLYGKEKFKASAKFLAATPEQFNQVCRIFVLSVLDSTVSSHTANAGQGLLKQVAEQYKKAEIEAIEAEQKDKRDKREERAAARIKALQAKKKEQKNAGKKTEKKKTPGNTSIKQESKKKAAKSKGKGIKALLK